MNIFSEIYLWVRLGAYAMALEWPFYLLSAAPWLLVTCLVYLISRRRLSPKGRIFFLSGMLAAGLAPCFGSHMAMFPMYLAILLSFIMPLHIFQYLYSLVSFGITWGIFILIGLGVATRGGTRPLGRTRPPVPPSDLENHEEVGLPVTELKRVEAEELKADKEIPDGLPELTSSSADPQQLSRDKVTRRISWRIIVPAAVIFLSLAVVWMYTDKGDADRHHADPRYLPLPGKILINISTQSGFVEYKFPPGDSQKFSYHNAAKARGNYYSFSCSDEFAKIYQPERKYYYDREDELAAIMSQYNLQDLWDLMIRRDWRNLRKEEHFLRGPGQKFEHFWGKYADHFLPNKQFTQVIFCESYPSRAMLLDLNTKQISFPFGFGHVENPVWDNTGRYVAYDFTNDLGQPIFFVATDIRSGQTQLRIPFEKYANDMSFWSPHYHVADITWSPDSKYVAILVGKASLAWKLPWEYIMAKAGHGILNQSFALSVYDLSGNFVFSKQLAGSFKSGGEPARLAWAE